MRSNNPTGKRCNRGDKDHTSPATFTHARGHSLSKQKSRAQIDIHSLIPLLQCEFFQALASTRTGITDQNIDRTKLRLRPINQRQHFCWLAYVAAHRNSSPSHLMYMLCQHLSSLFLPFIPDRDIGSGRCQTKSCGIPDPTTGSRYQGNTSAKIHHHLL